MALDRLIQNDYSAGTVRAGDRTLIPPNGAYELDNLLLRDDGLPSGRGGSAYKSNAAFGAAGQRGIWEAGLAAGQRTVFANAADFGVLGPDDATPVNLGGSGCALPVRAAVSLDGLLFIESESTFPTIYAGSRKAADYSTGTVAVTDGSPVVTGAGTLWGANADAGMLFGTGTGPRRVVKSVDSDTQLTLDRPFVVGPGQPGGAGQTYLLSRISTAFDPGSSGDFTPGHGPLATVASRILIAVGTRLHFSQIADSPVGIARPAFFVADDFHEFGAILKGVFPIRDAAFVFTTDGVFSVSNLALDLTDADGNPQHRVERLNRDLVLWHRSGVAEFSNALIVPAEHGVWLMDGYSAPLLMSGQIEDLYDTYTRAGYRPGGAAVYDGHYWLPIIDSSGNVIDQLVCRLEPTRAAGAPPFAWATLSGEGGNVVAFAVRSGAPQQLLGAGRAATSRVIRHYFRDPSAANALDADGSPVVWRLTTRDFGTGGLVRNFVVRLRVLYELVGATASFSAEVADEETGAFTTLTGSAPPDTGDTPKFWQVRKRRRYVRFRLTGSGSSFVLKALEIFVRKSGRY